MLNRFLNRWAARRLSAVAHEQRANQREIIKGKAQSMRRTLGLPDHPSLTTKGN